MLCVRAGIVGIVALLFYAAYQSIFGVDDVLPYLHSIGLSYSVQAQKAGLNICLVKLHRFNVCICHIVVSLLGFPAPTAGAYFYWVCKFLLFAIAGAVAQGIIRFKECTAAGRARLESKDGIFEYHES